MISSKVRLIHPLCIFRSLITFYACFIYFRSALLSVFLPAEISKSPVSKVPPELARHESAQHKVSREMKRKRDADDQG